MKLQKSHYLLFLIFILSWGCDPGVNTFHDLASESRETRPVGRSDALVEADVRQTLNDAGVSMENLQLDWVQQKSYPLYIKDKNIVVVPVAGKEDFILFYREKGRIGFKYLHPYSTAGAATPFGERAFRVVVNNGDLQGISEEIQGIDTRLKKLTIRSCEWPPLKCPGEKTIWDWIGNVWSKFKQWASDQCSGFTASTDGGYTCSTPYYFMSNGWNSWGQSPGYQGIPSDEIGVHYSGGGSGVYDQDGEIFALNVVQALNILPNLGGQHPEYGQWLEDNPQKAGEIWMFLNGSNNYSSASKKAAIKYIELMKNDAGFRSANVSLTDQVFLDNPEAFTAASLLYETLKSEFSGSIWPTHSEWSFFKQSMKSVLPDLLVGIIPGSSVIDIVNDLSYGNYWAVALDFVDLVVDFCPGCKVAKVIENVTSGLGKVHQILSKWRFLRNIDVNFISKMPLNWNVKMANSNKGVRWINPDAPSKDHIRVMQGDPSAAYPSQRVPYFVRYKNNKFLDKYGNVINPNTGNAYTNASPEVHISWDDFDISVHGF